MSISFLQVSRRVALRAVMPAIAAAMLLGLAASPARAADEPLPVSAFFGTAQLRSAKLSPSGRWLVALTAVAGKRVGFLVVDLDGKDGNYFVEASERDDVVWFRWVDDDWIVFSVYNPDDRRFGGFGSGLMVTRRDGKASRMLIARDWDPGDAFTKRRALEPNHFYMGPGAPGTTEVVIGEAFWDNRVGTYTRVTPKALDVATGAVRTLGGGDAPRADSWWFDANGRPRVASRDEEKDTVVYWADADGKWRQIDRSPSLDRPFTPAYVEGTDQLVVDVADASGATVLKRFDLAAGKPAGEVLLKTPGFDGGVGVRRDRGTGIVRGLDLKVDTETTVWLTPGMKRLQEAVDAKLPGQVNVLQCQPCDNPRRVLIYSYSDVNPGTFVLYRPDQDSWQLIGQARPDIDPARMSHLDFHRIKARDGEDLPVWVTRPNGVPTGKPAPAVVVVHGGPWLRGTDWAWDPWTQFLASRGYVVIQPEFRGSTGYTRQHFRAGWKQWGLAMQDDVSDALKFAVDQGWVDPARVCILGGSYGGYATLMGLVKDPKQYRCGVAIAAVSDPRNMFDFHWSDISEESKRYSMPQLLGDRVADDAKFAATSPLVHADRIQAPLLLVHGAIDKRVPVQNAERMRDALTRNGKSVEWVLYPDEGHSFRYEKNQIDLWTRIESFLARQLK